MSGVGTCQPVWQTDHVDSRLATEWPDLGGASSGIDRNRLARYRPRPAWLRMVVATLERIRLRHSGCRFARFGHAPRPEKHHAGRIFHGRWRGCATCLNLWHRTYSEVRFCRSRTTIPAQECGQPPTAALTTPLLRCARQELPRTAWHSWTRSPPVSSVPSGNCW